MPLIDDNSASIIWVHGDGHRSAWRQAISYKDNNIKLMSGCVRVLQLSVVISVSSANWTGFQMRQLVSQIVYITWSCCGQVLGSPFATLPSPIDLHASTCESFRPLSLVWDAQCWFPWHDHSLQLFSNLSPFYYRSSLTSTESPLLPEIKNNTLIAAFLKPTTIQHWLKPPHLFNFAAQAA